MCIKIVHGCIDFFGEVHHELEVHSRSQCAQAAYHGTAFISLVSSDTAQTQLEYTFTCWLRISNQTL
jgi:hypothetical protein